MVEFELTNECCGKRCLEAFDCSIPIRLVVNDHLILTNYIRWDSHQTNRSIPQWTSTFKLKQQIL